MGKIVAVILTVNRVKYLGKCIESLLRQKVDSIIVVENTSEHEIFKEIEEEYKNEKVFFIKNKKNLGSAGGYGRGIEKAYRMNADWVWIFDDDCEAKKNSLKELILAKEELERNKERIGFLTSLQIYLDGGMAPVTFNSKNPLWLRYFPKSIAELKWSVYTGTLINMKAVKKKGLPIKEMFLYEDDTEFTYRISQDYKGFLVGKSQILHKDYLSKRENFGPSTKNLKRYRTYLRNKTYFMKILFKNKDKQIAVIFFLSILNSFFKDITKFPILLFSFFEGLFFHPRIERI